MAAHLRPLDGHGDDDGGHGDGHGNGPRIGGAGARGRRPSSSRLATLVRPALMLVAFAIVLWLLLVATGRLLTHTGPASPLQRADLRVDRWLAAHRSAFWNSSTHWATLGAETTTVLAVGVVAAAVFWWRTRTWIASGFLAVAVIGEVSIFVCTTLLVERHRPGVPRLDSAPPTSSFPSGHTAASVALYAGIAVAAFAVGAPGWLRRLLVVIAVVAPVLVATSRLYRGMHFPTDVVAGALLGLAWVLACRAVLLSRPHRRTSAGRPA
ncbi:phosphatase PAP2 family protein [Jatrophihabitans telluris]|uniref:Phosphatase PAP2 family protein n=1 Tax=Jatrophihabitans telluris TaxID=2038343 RepID=A0ABY4QYA8_9ACTN|nr:phosphatase PAP2 family protein [Jatrophihabitans telluris]UQX88207.1 phosphatase PAP2 family protein [Jatrophihabitans telluris]